MAEVTNEQVLTEVKDLNKSLSDQIKDLKKSLTEKPKDAKKPGESKDEKEKPKEEDKKEEDPPGWLDYAAQLTGFKDQLAAFKQDILLGIVTLVAVTGIKIDYEKLVKQVVKKSSGGRRELETGDWGLPKLKRVEPEPTNPPDPPTGTNRITSTQLTQAHTAADELSASLRQLATVMQEAERAAAGLT